MKGEAMATAKLTRRQRNIMAHAVGLIHPLTRRNGERPPLAGDGLRNTYRATIGGHDERQILPLVDAGLMAAGRLNLPNATRNYHLTEAGYDEIWPIIAR